MLTTSAFIEIAFKIQEPKAGKYFIVIILLGMLYLIYQRYNKKQVIEELKGRYKDERLKRNRIRGWLFILYFILVLLVPICVGYMRHNLGMNI